jgi:uncharacterized protein (TIGR02996 family)
MPIWFVYRSPYDGPMSKHVKRLDGADTLLDWFCSIWEAIPDRDEASTHARDLLGTDVYCFGYFFVRIAEENLSPPTSVEELHEAVENTFYIGDGEYRGTPDTIQIATDDDEVGLAMYWFTDAFARAHPERVAFLLRDDWRLPLTLGPGGFKQKPGVIRHGPRRRGDPALFVVQVDMGSCGEIEDRSPSEKIPGRRLPDLVPWLLSMSEDEVVAVACSALISLHARLRYLLDKDKPKGLEASFRKSLAEDPADAATWSAYSDWLIERDRPRAELHLLELAARLEGATNETTEKPLHLQVGEHSLALMLPQELDNEYDQWYFFDDIWASGNVDLANAILDDAARFNVLDGWKVQAEYSPGIPAGKERQWKDE